MEYIVEGTATAHEWGLVLAAPVAICLFLTTIVLALLAKTSPQMNLFSIGFALRLGVGLVAAFLFFPNLTSVIGKLFENFGEYVSHLR